jgi:hypothetical protein
MNKLFDKSQPQNVHGLERAASLTGGAVLLTRGLRRGGLIGLAELAMGGMALLRGISGRCEMKRKLAELEARAEAGQDTKPDTQRYSHMPLDSEVRSPDFERAEVKLPDAAPMGHETHVTPRPLS